MRLSTSQIDKLGDRLRHSETIADVSDEDLALFQAVREQRTVVLEDVVRALREIRPGGRAPLRPTFRPKTLQTTHEKLRRERSRLSTIQDLVGARIVIDGGHVEQDSTVAAIVAEFPEHTVIDRRLVPSHGYRAVHVVVTHMRCPVEVQIRTRYQDAWAQLFEKLGDLWGRQIRYGDEPDNPAEPVGEPPNRMSRRDVVRMLLGLSDVLHQVEVDAAEAQRRLAGGRKLPRKLKKRCKRALGTHENLWPPVADLLNYIHEAADVPTGDELP